MNGLNEKSCIRKKKRKEKYTDKKADIIRPGKTLLIVGLAFVSS